MSPKRVTQARNLHFLILERFWQTVTELVLNVRIATYVKVFARSNEPSIGSTASSSSVRGTMTRLVESLPPASKTCKFRVAIGCPEKWKVQSIANFKKVQAVKAAKIAARIKAVERNIPAKSEGSSHKNHIPIDHIKKELDILHNNSIVIRNKMMALSSVRTSLLWLLKKSNMVERSVIG